MKKTIVSRYKNCSMYYKQFWFTFDKLYPILHLKFKIDNFFTQYISIKNKIEKKQFLINYKNN